jgi:antirestriction protein ArdC
MRDIHKEIVEGILAELKTGVRPRPRPWLQTLGLNVPADTVTRRMLLRWVDQRDARIDDFIAATGAKIQENKVWDAWARPAAYVNGKRDYISMPPFELFRGKAEYTIWLFHEIVHWSAHPSRLDRQLEDAAEEIVAELGSAFLAVDFSIDGFVRSHASYIQGYLPENASEAIYIAALLAEDAVNFLHRCSRSGSQS